MPDQLAGFRPDLAAAAEPAEKSSEEPPAVGSVRLRTALGPPRPVLRTAAAAAQAEVSAAAQATADGLLAAAGRTVAQRLALQRSGRSLPLDRDGSLVVGRSPDQGVAIAVGDGLVSKRHCKVVVAGGAVTVEDLSSTNGTEVVRNGRRLQVVGPVALQPGDAVAVVAGPVLFDVVAAP